MFCDAEYFKFIFQVIDASQRFQSYQQMHVSDWNRDEKASLYHQQTNGKPDSAVKPEYAKQQWQLISLQLSEQQRQEHEKPARRHSDLKIDSEKVNIKLSSLQNGQSGSGVPSIL
jgi:hypothetical protein